jgi:hypothetical protein
MCVCACVCATLHAYVCDCTTLHVCAVCIDDWLILRVGQHLCEECLYYYCVLLHYCDASAYCVCVALRSVCVMMMVT